MLRWKWFRRVQPNYWVRTVSLRSLATLATGIGVIALTASCQDQPVAPESQVVPQMGHSSGLCPFGIDIDVPRLVQGEEPIEWDETYKWGIDTCGPAHTTVEIEWYRNPDSGGGWIYLDTTSCHGYDGFCTAYFEETYTCGQQLDSFDLIAYPTATGQFSYEHFTVNSPIRCRLSVSISGPTSISTEGNHNWEAMPSGGDGSYSYQWKVYWYNTGGWQTLGTGKIQSLYIDSSDGDFDIKVTVSSDGQTAQRQVFVWNQLGCPGQEIC